MRLIDADALGNRMYHESFEKDSDLQRWDGGCWIRYKLFEQVLRAAPTIDLTHPTQLTDEDKETIRIHLSAFKERLCNQHRWNEAEEYEELISRLLSTSSVQPRKGKWIEHDDGWANVYYECSVCKEPFVLIDGTPTENLYNFCPNCGADMREGDSE